MAQQIEATDAYLSTLKSRIGKAKAAESPASSLGQWIGGIVSSGVTQVLETILSTNNQYGLMKPATGKKRTTLPNARGQQKEIDDVVCNSQGQPIVLSESKWLKDARHLNDKGAWVALMSEVKQANPTVKGIIAVLAGPWSAGGNVDALNKIVKVVPIGIAEVYTLLSTYGVAIEINTTRNIYLNPKDALDTLLALVEEKASEGVHQIATMGLELVGPHQDEIRKAIDDIIALPDDLDMVDIVDITEVAVVYKTRDGVEFRELYGSTEEAAKRLRKL